MNDAMHLLSVPAEVWLQVFGRLHVVFVHFPIALLLVAALVEGWRLLRRHTTASSAAVLCLALGAASALLASAMGWFHKEGYPVSRTLTLHQWLGIATVIAALIPLMLVGFQRFPKVFHAYRVALFICAVLVGITGHLGGSLTHGDDYLTALFHPEAPAPAVAPQVAALNSADEFTVKVQPILVSTCYDCHGPAKSRGGLRLDSPARLLKGGTNGPCIVPGDSAKSLLILRVKGMGSEKRMPLDHPPLTPVQIQTLASWIDQGAKLPGGETLAAASSDPEKQDHWAYNKPIRPAVPSVKEATWVKNPIDAFLLARLEKEGIKPSPEADRITLIRRLSFDLTGLPPSPEEVDAFVKDRSPDAYDKVVDRLMASPHYGERMAVYWLDLVRFGDTLGIHSDTQKKITPYRDWVINAFNKDEPYNQFTIEQIAGDLLPNPTLEQKVASGYNRLLITSEEGGAQPREYIAKYAADRVRNVSSVWMGATMACCECHNHKFDPYSQKDFYRMEAFFADVKDNPVGRHEDTAEMPLPSPQQQAQIKVIDDKIAKLNGVLNTSTPELEAAQMIWEKTALQEVQWQAVDPSSIQSTAKAKLVLLPDHSILAGGDRPETDNYNFTAAVPSAVKGSVTAFRLEVLPDISLPLQGPGRFDNGNFALTGITLTATPAAGGSPAPIAIQHITTDHVQDQWEATDLVDGKTHIPGGWAILPEVGKTHTLIFETATDLPAGSIFTLTLQQQLGNHPIGRFRISVTGAARPIGVNILPDDVRKFLTIPPAKRRNKAREGLLAYYRSIAPSLNSTRAEITKLQQQKNVILASAPKTEITEAIDTPRVIRILARGNWLDDTGEIVTPAVPHFLKQPDIGDRRATRLDLAKWLVDKDNPMTARVYVNRLWKMFYGIGLSKTLEDMGTQGEKPVNPELLDWLATEFIQSGWDVKHMVRLMVTSDAYRQSSAGSKFLRERDPFNRLVARQSPFRLEGEFIRDNALAMAGILAMDVGGQSVKPYQPAGYWDFLNFPKRTWVADNGAEGHRRTLYTWWQRTFLHPSLINFDVPDRTECTCNRNISNTPLQALDLLNDPIYVEAARMFAQRIIKEGGSNDVDRLTWAYRQALSRAPAENERKILTDLLEKHLKKYSADPKSAAEILTVGTEPADKNINPVQIAAWTSVARTIINLHETITRM